MENLIYEVRDLSFAYRGEKRVVLDHCSLELHPGEILSVLGPNGAGKSTLLNCLCHLLEPRSGEIKLCGKNISSYTTKEIARYVGYVQQRYSPVFDYRVLDYVMMGRAANIRMFHSPKKEDENLAGEALASLGITHLADKPFTELSGGEQQQVTIARVIVQKPRVILFDEPTAHLDYGKQIVTLRLIKQMAAAGYAVIMTTHNPDHAILLAGKVGLLRADGRFEIGDTDQIITQKRMREIYDTELCMVQVEPLKRMACIPPNL